MRSNVLLLRCLVCGAEFASHEIDYVCPRHGLEGIVDVVYDYEAVAETLPDPGSLPLEGIWRWRPLLPVEPDSPVPPLLIGDTPQYEAPRLAFDAGVAALWVKDEGRQPTGSLKDRASAVAVVRAAEGGYEVACTASTGNAAAALAGVCASVGMRCVIFVPASAPAAKVAQLGAYGATVFLVEGSYDQAYDLCTLAAMRYGWYNRSTGFNPYMSEGKKTAAYEICESLGWEVPDAVMVSVGDGCIIGALHKGFADLVELQWIDRMPRLIGVQAEGSAFLAEAWRRGENVLDKAPIEARTVADSIAAGLPRDRLKAMRAVVDTGGAFVTVGDDEILAAIPVLAQGAGVFAEPAAAAAYAGIAAALKSGALTSSDHVVVLSTGTGLKDVPAVEAALAVTGPRPITVEPDPVSLERVLAKTGGVGS